MAIPESGIVAKWIDLRIRQRWRRHWIRLHRRNWLAVLGLRWNILWLDRIGLIVVGNAWAGCVAMWHRLRLQRCALRRNRWLI